MSHSPARRSLSWLHLSDWHQGGSDFDRLVTRDALLDDLRAREQIDSDLSKIDFVVFSGDLAFSGSMAEYTAAYRELLAPVMEAVDLADRFDRLVIVPGNHDIDRNTVTSVKQEIPTLLDKPIDSWLDGEWRRNAIMSTFKQYAEFCSTILRKDPSTCALNWNRTFEVEGSRIGIAGFNSALLSSFHRNGDQVLSDYGRLQVGERQVHDTIRSLSDCEIVVAVLHHPLSWLVEHDCLNIEGRLLGGCHFILHGHEHRPRARAALDTLGECIIIPGGASYDRRRPSDSRFTNSYNFATIDLERRRGELFFRHWNENRTAWSADYEAADMGRYCFALPKTHKRNPAPWRQRASVTVLSSVATAVARRPMKRLDVEFELRDCACTKEVDLLELVIHHRVWLPAGHREPFGIHTTGDRRTLMLLAKAETTIESYHLKYFQLDGVDIEPKIEEGGARYEVQLPVKECYLEYAYHRHVPSDSVFLFRVSRFVHALTLRMSNSTGGHALKGHPIGGSTLPRVEVDPPQSTSIRPDDPWGVPPYHAYLLEWYVENTEST